MEAAESQLRDEMIRARLLPLFWSEAAARVRSMEAQLEALLDTDAPERRREITETLARDAHSLVGSSRTLQIRGVDVHAARLEWLFGGDGESGSELATTARPDLDAITRLVAEAGRASGGVSR